MIHRLGPLAAALLIAGLSIAPISQAQKPRSHPAAPVSHGGSHPAASVSHGGGHPGPAPSYGPEYHGGDGAAAAIIGGLIGLGIGAAITSGGAYPPPYYGPPPGYYGPPPPGVYYGYGY
jgi:hypothetical protein